MVIKESERINQLADSIDLHQLINESDFHYDHGEAPKGNSTQFVLEKGIECGIRLTDISRRWSTSEAYVVKPKRGHFLYFIDRDEQEIITRLDDLSRL